MRQRTLSFVILAALVLVSGTLAGCNGTKDRMAALEADNEIGFREGSGKRGVSRERVR